MFTLSFISIALAQILTSQKGTTTNPDSMNVTVLFEYSPVQCSGVLLGERDIVITAGHCVEKGMGGKKKLCKEPEVTNSLSLIVNHPGCTTFEFTCIRFVF